MLVVVLSCNLYETLTEPSLLSPRLLSAGPKRIDWGHVVDECASQRGWYQEGSAGWRSGASSQAAHPHPRSATICNHLLITVALRARAAAAMLYKLLVCILLTTSADALEAGPISRRALLGKATAGAFLSSPLAAFARDPLKQASDAAVYDRADEGSLTSARVIQRAETNQLVVGQGTPLPLMAARRPPQAAM